MIKLGGKIRTIKTDFENSQVILRCPGERNDSFQHSGPRPIKIDIKRLVIRLTG